MFWDTLRNVAAHYDVTGVEVDTAVVCVDERHQWKPWTNGWQSAAISSSIYMLGAPFRALSGKSRRNHAAH